MIGKQEFAEHMASKTGLTVTLCTGVVEKIISEIGTETMTNGNAVKIAQLGTFEPAFSAARVGRNVRTLEPAPIPSRTKLRFKAAKSLKLDCAE